MRRRSACLFLMLGVMLFLAGATTYPGMKSLSGQFNLTGQTPVDPPSSERRNTRLRLLLTGAVAKELYEHMQVAPVGDACGDPLDQAKIIGEMECVLHHETGAHECRFAIDIAKQKIAGGWAC